MKNLKIRRNLQASSSLIFTLAGSIFIYNAVASEQKIWLVSGGLCLISAGLQGCLAYITNQQIKQSQSEENNPDTVLSSIKRKFKR